ncbi:hypothetical protein [Nocardia xishanensis]|uniref:hypothetical protein n=1 Tax=Nocardia xishanensis TaxID=238964 RepID=UPI00083723EB|nr:hypothetical protein [Nocardia xishanensis]
MGDRLSDELFDEISHAIPFPYMGGDYPENLSQQAREWIGPDGGTLSLLNELRDERARLAEAVQAMSKSRMMEPIYVSAEDLRLDSSAADLQALVAEVHSLALMHWDADFGTALRYGEGVWLH